MPTKQPMPPVPPLQPLLFWETGVLLFVAGIVTARFPVPALTACALFAWVDSRTRRPLCCLLAAACVIAGWWIGEKSVPRVPQEYPAWLEKSLSSRRAVTVEGVIVGSRGLPDQRLQIILDDVGPAEKEPLPGRMALTWQDMPDVPRPLPGQRITADLKIRPVHGFHNQGWIRRKKAASARFPLPVRTETLPGRRPCRPKTLGANRLHPHGGRTSRPLLSRLGRYRLKRFGNIQVRLRTPQLRRIRGAFQGCGTADLPSSRPCCSGIAMGSTRRTWSASTRRG